MSKFREKGLTPPGFALALLAAVAVPMLPLLTAKAQIISPSDSLQSVPTDAQVRIDGDPSLKPTTQALSNSFGEQFPHSKINYESQGSDAAVTGVISGRLDAAAIGRSLTTLEKQAGVTAVSLPREKIATFVGTENSFRGDISHQQFAQIFRGEITNWAELGGEDVPIRFVDLTANSDTRRSLSSYGIFQAAAFENGDTVTTQPNNISSVIETLGSDGLGYALFEQVKNRSDIRILPMHGVMPTDARYPFSQPRSFAYLGENPTPEAIAFLNHVGETVPEADFSQANLAALGRAENQSLDHNAPAGDSDRPEDTTARPAAFGPVLANSDSVADKTATGQTAGNQTVSGSSNPSGNSLSDNVAGNLGGAAIGLGSAISAAGGANEGDPGGVSDGTVAPRTVRYRPSIMDTIHAPWWWLLPLLPLGVIGAAALRRRKRLTPAEAEGSGIAAPLQATTGSASATPIANDDAAGFALETPHRQTISTKESPSTGLAGAGLAGMGLAGARKQTDAAPSIDKALERPNGGKKAVPIQGQSAPSPELQYSNPKYSNPKPSHSPTEPITSVDQPAQPLSPEATGTAQGPASRLAAPMAGVGNSDNEETWITLTPLNSHQGEVNWHLSSEHRLQAKQRGGQQMMIRIHDADPSSQTEQWLPGNYSYECSNGMDRKQVDLPVPDRDYVAELGFLTAEEEWIHVARSVHSHSPTPEYDGCRIVIMPCDRHRQIHSGPTRHPKPQAYVYWDIAPEFKRRLRKQGGQKLVLRIYDVDRIDLDQQQPHHTDEYMLDENARDKVVAVPIAEHDYVAEIGYLTMSGEFLSLGRSTHAHIPVTTSYQKQ